MRLILVIGIVITPLISIRSWVSAQGSSAPLWVVRSLYTSEYGVNEPKGLAFSSMANTFLILDGSADTALVSMGEDNLGIRNLSGIQNDPLNVAFDNQTGSLFEFNRGKSELAEFRADDKGLPDVSAPPTHFAVNAFGIKEAVGITFGSDDGRLFILDAGNLQIVSVVPHPTLGFDANEAIRSNKVGRISLKKLGIGPLEGIAYNPDNGHFYVSEPAQKRLYELTQAGDLVSVFDLAALGINDPSAMTFAPSGDTTDDPNTMDLYVLDAGQTAQKAESLFHFASTVSMQATASSSSQIVELSLVAPAVLPAGTTLLPATLVHTIDTSTWSNPSPDPSGVDYWPPTGQLLISDSEVEESVGGNPPVYWHGYNVFLSTLSGSLAGNCTTFTSSPVGLTYNNFSDEPTGVAINPNNNHIFFSDDGTNSRIVEIGPGPDGVYCTSDDTVTKISVTNLYGATDAEDVAYGNNTLYEADGINAEVYVIPLGADGVISGDDGPVTHWDTAVLGFHDLEGIGYNADSGTLFIASTEGSENYLGEVTTSGTLIHVYDLSFMGTAYNLRSDVAYAPSSQNPAVKDIYIVSRGVDNNTNRFENDGKVWEINISNDLMPWIFSDVPDSYWAWNFVERLYTAGITGGCGVNPRRYCPEGTVTRAQMAVFLERGIHGSSYNPPTVGSSTGFGDVSSTYWASAWIKQLAAEGITGGCGRGNYCPEAPVTRAQMAVFLLRSKYGSSYNPPAVGGSTGFGDVQPSYWAGAWIKQLVAEGITAGCGSGNYCPEAPVTRAQMAVFLVRTFNLP